MARVRTFDISPVTIGGSTTVADLTPTLNITALISGDASSGINKTGAGILQLSAANTYGGPTTIAGGTLKYGIANALPTTTALNLSTAGASVDLAGFNATVGSLAGVAGTTLTNLVTSGSVTLTTGGDNTSTTFAGVITPMAGSTLSLVRDRFRHNDLERCQQLPWPHVDSERCHQRVVHQQCGWRHGHQQPRGFDLRCQWHD